MAMTVAKLRSGFHSTFRGGKRTNILKLSFASNAQHEEEYEMSKWEKITYAGIITCTILAIYNLSKGHPHYEEPPPYPYLHIRNKEFPCEFCGEICHRETDQWFFFTPQQKKEARGWRTSRSTLCGYWKATGSPSVVYSTTQKKAIGVKKTMIFYMGKTPMGKKTKWNMNVYKVINEEAAVVMATRSTLAASFSSGNTATIPEVLDLTRLLTVDSD